MINYAELNGGSITLKFRATSSKDQFEFNYNQVLYDDSEDAIFKGQTGKKRKGKTYILKFAGDLQTDWAYYQTNKKSPVRFDKDRSMNLEAGENLMIFGFAVTKESSGKDHIKPFFTESSVTQNGLSPEGVYAISDRSFEGGNSGGPVMIFNPEMKSEIICIGIMAFGDFETRSGVSLSGGVVPIANLKEMDVKESLSHISE